MMSRIFPSKTYLPAILLHLSFLIGWVTFVLISGRADWWLALSPGFLLGQMLLRKTEQYKIEGNTLLVKNIFERKEIDLQEIRKVEEVTNPSWKQLLLGLPRYSLHVHYQKYEEAILNPGQPQALQEILRGDR